MSTTILIEHPEPRMTCHAGELIHKNRSRRKTPATSTCCSIYSDSNPGAALPKPPKSKCQWQTSSCETKSPTRPRTTESRFRHHPCNLSTKHEDSPLAT